MPVLSTADPRLLASRSGFTCGCKSGCVNSGIQSVAPTGVPAVASLAMPTEERNGGTGTGAAMLRLLRFGLAALGLGFRLVGRNEPEDGQVIVGGNNVARFAHGMREAVGVGQGVVGEHPDFGRVPLPEGHRGSPCRGRSKGQMRTWQRTPVVIFTTRDFAPTPRPALRVVWIGGTHLVYSTDDTGPASCTNPAKDGALRRGASTANASR